MTTRLALVYLGAFLLIAGIIAAIGVQRLLVAAVALPFVTIAAAAATAGIWLFCAALTASRWSGYASERPARVVAVAGEEQLLRDESRMGTTL
jgi:hypothetical protein